MQEKRLHVYVCQVPRETFKQSVYKPHVQTVSLGPQVKHFGVSVLTHCITDATPCDKR